MSLSGSFVRRIAAPESVVYNPPLFTKLPFDPDSDFAPVHVDDKLRSDSSVRRS